jgi:hypothetical protein
MEDLKTPNISVPANIYPFEDIKDLTSTVEIPDGWYHVSPLFEEAKFLLPCVPTCKIELVEQIEPTHEYKAGKTVISHVFCSKLEAVATNR